MGYSGGDLVEEWFSLRLTQTFVFQNHVEQFTAGDVFHGNNVFPAAVFEVCTKTNKISKSQSFVHHYN